MGNAKKEAESGKKAAAKVVDGAQFASEKVDREASARIDKIAKDTKYAKQQAKADAESEEESAQDKAFNAQNALEQAKQKAAIAKAEAAKQLKDAPRQVQEGIEFA